MVGTYKCPGCGAPIEFDSNVGRLKCDYCGTEVGINEIDKEKDKYDTVVEDKTVEEDSSYCDFNGYKCSSCGGEIITDEHTTATTCSYCGSPAIIQARLTGQLMPKKVIPFRIDKEKAKNMFKEWTRKGKLTPSCFKREAFVDSMQGVYVPYWLYDYGTHVDMQATCTRVRKERHGNTEKIHTSYYEVVRSMNAVYEKVPADASAKMPDESMDLLEPFDYNELKDFQMPYLSGYVSEKYNFTKEELNSRAERRTRHFAFSACRESITGFNTVNVTNSSVRMQMKQATYALLPVWAISYVYKGEKYFFAINGQTGKKVGKLPVSVAKTFAWFGGVFAGVSGILFLLGGILG